MEYKTLREKVKNHPKYQGCINVNRAPLIHDGFPGTFNLSFPEYDWLKEYGRFIDFDHDFVSSVVQSCIRVDDFPSLHTQDSWKYLGIFEIGILRVLLTYLNVQIIINYKDGRLVILLNF